MDIRTRLCFELSRRLMTAPAKRTANYSDYDKWRQQSLRASWNAGFSNELVTGKDVLDFGCGDGQLSFFLEHLSPRSITGVDINADAVDRANAAAKQRRSKARFVLGNESQMPIKAGSVDTILAFDCLEHVMQPLEIFREWNRVLRPGGIAAAEWFPFKGPWGPHMESLIPIPWAHVIFGQRAMFRAAEAIYDLPTFTPRHWDLDERGVKKPNKWRQWSTFREQSYVNEMDVPTFGRLAHQAGLEVRRLDRRGFSGGGAREAIGWLLKSMPLVGDYFVSYTLIELQKPG